MQSFSELLESCRLNLPQHLNPTYADRRADIEPTNQLFAILSLDQPHEFGDGDIKRLSKFEDHLHAGAIASQFKKGDVIPFHVSFVSERLLRQFLPLS
jgi:hypothetical protein